MKHIAIASFVCVVLSVVQVSAQTDNYSFCSYRHFKGTIGTTSATFELVSNPDGINGFYYIENTPTWFRVEGENEKHSLTLNEYNMYDQNTGIFNGEWQGTDKFKGEWQSTDGSQNLQFEFTEDYTDKAARMACYEVVEKANIANDPNMPAASIRLLWLQPDNLGYLTSKLESMFFGSIQTGMPDENLKTITDSYFKKYQQEMGTDADADQSNNWEYETSAMIYCNTGNLMSVEIKKREYYGAETGVENFEYAVFETTKGKRIAYYDIISQDYDQQLGKLITREIKQKLALDDHDKLTDMGFQSDEVMPAYDSFFLTPNGIGFYYNPYSIATTEVGALRVFLPYSEIKQFLVPDCIVSKWLK